MADFTISTDSRAAAVAQWFDGVMLAAQMAANTWSTFPIAALPPQPKVTFKMRGMDAVVVGRYDTWTAGAPDYSATYYHGALATPLRDVVVVDQWSVTAAPS